MVNPDCQEVSTLVDPGFRILVVNGAANSGMADPQGNSHGRGAEVGWKDDSHTSQYRTSCNKRKGVNCMPCEIARNARKHQTPKMPRPRKTRETDRWPQRLDVLKWIDEKLQAGVTVEELVKEFGLKTSYSIELGWRFGQGRAPGRKSVELMAKYFGKDEWEIYGPKPEPSIDKVKSARNFLLSQGMGIGEVNMLTDADFLTIQEVALAAARSRLPK